ncbi:hypothetical protein ANO11243_003640 [Dothideomycetidae sp. 11243]|nr:hypothetical protein ANO11243_003640 [fungal sp. No.11243]
MAPSTGGQYFWVSEFDYELIPWRSTLMTIPPLAVVLGYTLFAHKYLPMLQNFTVILHVMGAVLIIITLWVAAPHVTAKEVVLDISNQGAYSNVFIMFMIGQLSPIWGLTSMDAPVHMAEEVHNAAVALPRAMMYAFIFNGFLGFAMLTTVLFSMPDIPSALANPAGPFFYVVQQAWPTTGYAYTVWIVSSVVLVGNIPFAAAAARLTFAFARDGALPHHARFSTINQRLQVPVPAILGTIAFAFVMSFVKLGSATAFAALLSMCSMLQIASYTIPIFCILWRRIVAPQKLPAAKWSLGRCGIPINAIAALFGANTVFWMAWPTALPVDIDNFNFSAPLTVAIIGAMFVWYRIYGMKKYISPRERIKDQ